jgi:hypothetical protein
MLEPRPGPAVEAGTGRKSGKTLPDTTKSGGFLFLTTCFSGHIFKLIILLDLPLPQQHPLNGRRDRNKTQTIQPQG